MSELRNSGLGTRTMLLYVISNDRGLALGGRKWHIAAHEPTGYGLRALCGMSWSEGRFRTHGPGIAGPVCKRCKAINETRS